MIIVIILLAQGLVVGMGWWSGSRDVLTEVVDQYSRRVEASAQDTASGVALAIAKLDTETIEPGTEGGIRVQAMLDDLKLPGHSIVSIVSNDGRELYHMGDASSGPSAYTATVPLAKHNAYLRVNAPAEQLISARDAAASEMNLRIWLGGAVIILLTGIVALALISMHERRLVRANRVLGQQVQRKDSDLIAAREGMILGLAKLADYRDTDTGQHLDRICEYSCLLAKAASRKYPEISDHFIRSIRLAASLHDIGKVGIPDAILLKPGALLPHERELIEKHTIMGAQTLTSIRDRFGEDELLDLGIDIALCHHERWDGTGYPNRLRGNEIPFAARIVAIADVYDALTSARVYKPALSHTRAIEIMREGRATQFDPVLLDVFMSIAEEVDTVRRTLQPLDLPRAAKLVAA
ncbi:MAG: HD-GYP domain-containing protein [Phycisphaerales bacterium]|nr:HD-GYP domain-containing protein [Phycisphaerales bacterium]MCB9835235.1 HD-GYP domain-containing protein [Phycisphaera sp.]